MATFTLNTYKYVVLKIPNSQSGMKVKNLKTLLHNKITKKIGTSI